MSDSMDKFMSKETSSIFPSERRFIESASFPVGLVSKASEKEKQSGGRPPHYEMVFWWTRKPLISARAVIAGCLLPENASVKEFVEMIRLSEKSPYKFNPKVSEAWRKYFDGKRLLDPFAGFGSIPLEALRLGLDAVAVELLPSAYVFLKAVLEYPRKYAQDYVTVSKEEARRLGIEHILRDERTVKLTKWTTQKEQPKKENDVGGNVNRLIYDVARWGHWITEQLRNDPKIKELYDEDVAVYIGSWEIVCPFCRKRTPLVGNWWLARVKKGETEVESSRGTFERLAYMEPVVSGEKVDIRVRDLNMELEFKVVPAKVSKGTVQALNREFKVPEPNINARSNTAKCLHCNNMIAGKGEGDIWYVKEALRDWNRNLERFYENEITVGDIEKSLARPRLLVKVKKGDGDIKFEPCTESDQEKLRKAIEEVKELIEAGDPDIPREGISLYSVRYLFPILYGITEWYKLFNPRQLLVLVKLVKLIREAGKKIEQEKIKEGLSNKEAHDYAETITTYLALALANFVDFNSLNTYWEVVWGGNKRTMAVRGIAMMWNWCDVNPIGVATGTMHKGLEKVLEFLHYFASSIPTTCNKISVLLDDATALSKLNNDTKFDLIVTDPPYHDDVPYSELSDFYYVWLKRALSDCCEGLLYPRFHKNAFFNCLDDNCSKFVERRTQWEEFALKEVGVNDRRSQYFGEGVGSVESFREGLGKAFKAMLERLVDGGRIVTFYAHTDPKAWTALLWAGWQKNGLTISRAFPIVTEQEGRVTARGKVVLNKSIVVVWKPGAKGSAVAREVFNMAVDEVSQTLRKMWGGASPICDPDLYVDVLGKVLEVFTRYKDIVGVKSVEDLVSNYIYPATAQAIVRALASTYNVRPVSSKDSIFYLLSKIISPPPDVGLRRIIDENSLVMLAFSGGADKDEFVSSGVVVKKGGEAFELNEPRRVRDLTELPRVIQETLEETAKGRRRKRTAGEEDSYDSPVKVLHKMEYVALTKPGDVRGEVDLLRSKTLYLDEALDLARILVRVLGDDDVEREACTKLLSSLGEEILFDGGK